MKPKLVIFDFDGVIVNTEDIFSKILHSTLQNYNINIDFKTCCKIFTGNDTLTTLNKVAKEHNSTVTGSDIHEELLKNKKSWMNQITAFPYIKDILSLLKVPFCIASNSNIEHLHYALDVVKLNHFFNNNNIFSAATLGKYKPDPAVYLEALNKMGFKAEEAIAIDDSVPGVQAASAAKIRVIGHTGNKHVNHEEHSVLLKQSGAFITVNSLKEAIPLLT